MYIILFKINKGRSFKMLKSETDIKSAGVLFSVFVTENQYDKIVKSIEENPYVCGNMTDYSIKMKDIILDIINKCTIITIKPKGSNRKSKRSKEPISISFSVPVKEQPRYVQRSSIQKRYKEILDCLDFFNINIVVEDDRDSQIIEVIENRLNDNIIDLISFNVGDLFMAFNLDLFFMLKSEYGRRIEIIFYSMFLLKYWVPKGIPFGIFVDIFDISQLESEMSMLDLFVDLYVMFTQVNIESVLADFTEDNFDHKQCIKHVGDNYFEICGKDVGTLDPSFLEYCCIWYNKNPNEDKVLNPYSRGCEIFIREIMLRSV